ncbi:MAG: hypothetical protein N2691_03305 [Patescibacteria group bacterium]|nr:hypothetical protein [Patescibacteria group bacterium]
MDHLAQFADTLDRIRKSNDIFEKAKLIKYLKDLDVKLSHIAKALGMKPSYVAHYLRLNKLPDIIVDGYYSKLVSSTHLFILSRLKNDAQMIKVYDTVLSESLTALQTEELVREELYQTKTEGERYLPEEAARLERFLERAIDEKLRLKVIQTRIRAKFIIEVKGSLARTTPLLRKLQKLLSDK